MAKRQGEPDRVDELWEQARKAFFACRERLGLPEPPPAEVEAAENPRMRAVA